jgi:FtsH-binding integral membrane protein
MNLPTQQLGTASSIQEEDRAIFIRRTYTHLAVAVAVFVWLEYMFINHTPLPRIMLNFIGGHQYGWLMILGGFVLLGWAGRNMAAKADSMASQYLGLGIYVLGEAIIFVPILFIAAYVMEAPDLLKEAALMTGLMFCGLTATVFMTRKDFSFLRGALTMGGFVAMGLIVGGTIFGMSLGMWFSAGMVVLASGAILYDTSKILHHYPADKYVSASIELFASVALLFWYILRIFMNRR